MSRLLRFFKKIPASTGAIAKGVIQDSCGGGGGSTSSTAKKQI